MIIRSTAPLIHFYGDHDAHAELSLVQHIA